MGTLSEQQRALLELTKQVEERKRQLEEQKAELERKKALQREQAAPLPEAGLTTAASTSAAAIPQGIADIMTGKTMAAGSATPQPLNMMEYLKRTIAAKRAAGELPGSLEAPPLPPPSLSQPSPLNTADDERPRISFSLTGSKAPEQEGGAPPPLPPSTAPPDAAYSPNPSYAGTSAGPSYPGGQTAYSSPPARNSYNHPPPPHHSHHSSNSQGDHHPYHSNSQGVQPPHHSQGAQPPHHSQGGRPLPFAPTGDSYHRDYNERHQNQQPPADRWNRDEDYRRGGHDSRGRVGDHDQRHYHPHTHRGQDRGRRGGRWQSRY